jgi:hypothetical protein
VLHYAQNIVDGAFREYDYGNDNDNIAHYGSKIIPIIHLADITKKIPIALFAGIQDPLAD